MSSCPTQVRRYQVLVSLMLSSQTKDQITGKAMANLKKHGLRVENILNTPREDIAKMIHAVGFWQVRETILNHFIIKKLFVYLNIPNLTSSQCCTFHWLLSCCLLPSFLPVAYTEKIRLHKTNHRDNC